MISTGSPRSCSASGMRWLICERLTVITVLPLWWARQPVSREAGRESVG